METVNKIYLQKRVQAALGWSELKYNTFQYETGIDYLNHYIPNDAESIALLERSRFFWNWWMKRWNDRDMEFVNNIQDTHSAHRESIYTAHHSPALLSSRIYPTRIIWQQSLKVNV